MKKYLRIALKQSPRLWFDVEMPDGFELSHTIAQLQAAGYFIWPQGYVPIDSIAYICVIELAPQAVDFTRAKLQ